MGGSLAQDGGPHKQGQRGGYPKLACLCHTPDLAERHLLTALGSSHISRGKPGRACGDRMLPLKLGAVPFFEFKADVKLEFRAELL